MCLGSYILVPGFDNQATASSVLLSNHLPALPKAPVPIPVAMPLMANGAIALPASTGANLYPKSLIALLVFQPFCNPSTKGLYCDGTFSYGTSPEAVLIANLVAYFLPSGVLISGYLNVVLAESILSL